MTSSPAFAAQLIRASARAFGNAVLRRLQEDEPAVLASLPSTFADPRDDLDVRLRHLAAAVEFDRPALIQNAVRWYAVAFHHRDVAADYLLASLAAIEAVLGDELPAAVQPVVRRHLAAARQALAGVEVDLPSHLDKAAPHGLLAGRFLLATLEGRGDDAVQLIKDAMDQGLTVAELHDCVLSPVQRETGRMWLMGEIQIADEHFSSVVVDRVLWHAQERLPRPPADAPIVLLMGVAGDLHGFGLRMIAQRLQAASLRVHNLGPDMPASDLAGALHERHFDAVALSATMALNLHALTGLVAEIRRLLGAAVPILVGGRPFAEVADLHRLVGADAAAVDAASAVAAINRLLGRPSGGAA